MADALILEFDGLGREHYEAVNGRLGIDPNDPASDWPEGMISHAGGAKPGGWVVVEVWDSRDAQERFMEERLAQALQEGGVTQPPSRVEWLTLAGYSTPGG